MPLYPGPWRRTSSLHCVCQRIRTAQLRQAVILVAPDWRRLAYRKPPLAQHKFDSRGNRSDISKYSNSVRIEKRRAIPQAGLAAAHVGGVQTRVGTILTNARRSKCQAIEAASKRDFISATAKERSLLDGYASASNESQTNGAFCRSFSLGRKIYNRTPFEREALAFVDGEGIGHLQRKLTERR